jgi:hypothetical protein
MAGSGSIRVVAVFAFCLLVCAHSLNTRAETLESLTALVTQQASALQALQANMAAMAANILEQQIANQALEGDFQALNATLGKAHSLLYSVDHAVVGHIIII